MDEIERLAEKVEEEMKNFIDEDEKKADEVVINIYGIEGLYEWFWKHIYECEKEELNDILDLIKEARGVDKNV